jgi:hypothetical protein
MVPPIYKFDQEKLAHVRFSRKRLIVIWLVSATVSFAIGAGSTYFLKRKESLPDYEELVILINEMERDQMSPKRIYEYMKEIGVNQPEVVWAQVAVETGFKSDILLESHNLFGMKKAVCRPNVQTGKARGHAVYHNWKMSVVDYAMWQSSTGAWKVKTQDGYLDFLNGRYAEDPGYIGKLREILGNFDAQLEKYESRFKDA